MLRKYEYRRKLPHFQPDHKVFFITFSTYKRRILPEAVRQIVIETCLAGNGKKFRLYGVVVNARSRTPTLISSLRSKWVVQHCRDYAGDQGRIGTSNQPCAGPQKGRFGKKSRLTAFCVARRTSVTSSITFSGTPLGQGWCEIPLSIAGCGEIRANWVACPEPTGKDAPPPSNYI